MKIAIIGAGFTGLSLAYKLIQKGHDVSIIESESKPGGLAIGFTIKRWKWSLERHYHHLFTNDNSILKLAKEIGQKIIEVRPKTSTYYNGEIFQIDSPMGLLSFNKLSLVSRIRAGITLLFIKISPFLNIYSEFTSERFLKYTMGQEVWEVLWKPLFKKKFHKDYKKISFVWFWARIKKRTPSLCYPLGGFQQFADNITKKLAKRGVVIYFNESFIKFVKVNKGLLIKTNKRKFVVDKIVNTQILKDTGIKMIGAMNLVLELDKPFLPKHTYWLNINDKDMPFLAIVEHSNFMNKKYYDNKHLIYIGNYLDKTDDLYNKGVDEILKLYMPYLIKINPDFKKKDIKNKYLFKAPNAQQVVTKGYSKKIPPFVSNIDGLYNANMQQVYPWDRGTNYAVEIGLKVSKLI